MTEATGYAALDACVHCGFCLPACPTYLATGDENDSPRGRIVLMRALERGQIVPSDTALRRHLDACLGCRGCEPACPSGVGYGRGLEAARADLARANGLPPSVRLALLVFRFRTLWRLAFGAARLLRDSGLAARLAGRGPVRSAFGLAAGSAPAPGLASAPDRRANGGPGDGARGRVDLFTGCVMDVLFSHVHGATRRTLEANGWSVRARPVGCCGAPHLHAGDLGAARSLARRTMEALPGNHPVVVNSAGCGAMLKDYGHLLGTDAARRWSARVNDVTELLAGAGPRRGAPIPARVAYDAPCHLLHAQGVHGAVRSVLAAVPGAELVPLPGAERCCGSAGLYNLTQPGMSAAVLEAKVADISSVSPPPDLLLTGNPGCIMQVAAGLRTAGSTIAVAHPVELLDRSYRDAGFYEEERPPR